MTNSAKNTLIAKVDALEAGTSLNVFGYSHVKFQIINAIMCGGHPILVSKPGLAKTALVSSIGNQIEGCDWHAEQFTADMRPSDIKGSRPYNAQTGVYDDSPGPIWNTKTNKSKHLLLADEINRAQPKTNGVLLRIMQEGFFNLGPNNYDMHPMFTVIATRNPVEQEGVFTLPEAVTDRFIFELRMGHETMENERKMLANPATYGRGDRRPPAKVISVEEIMQVRQEMVDLAVRAPQEVQDLVLHLVRATRPEDGAKLFDKIFALDDNEQEVKGQTFYEQIADGAGPRAEIAIMRSAAAVAWRRGLPAINPDCVKLVFRDCVRHRLYLTDSAKFGGFNADDFLTPLLRKVPILAGIKG